MKDFSAKIKVRKDKEGVFLYFDDFDLDDGVRSIFPKKRKNQTMPI